jgi:hypothetical protein
VAVQQAPHHGVDQQDTQPSCADKKDAKNQCQLPCRQLVEPVCEPIGHRFFALSPHTVGKAVGNLRACRGAPALRHALTEERAERHEMLRISVNSDLANQVMEDAAAAVRDAIQPAQCAALVNVLLGQAHQVSLRRRKLYPP